MMRNQDVIEIPVRLKDETGLAEISRALNAVRRFDRHRQALMECYAWLEDDRSNRARPPDALTKEQLRYLVYTALFGVDT